MGDALTTCKKFALEDAASISISPMQGYVPQGRPQLKLRVDWNPIRQSLGALLCPFSLTDEVVVDALDIRAPSGWQPLTWRHASYLKERDSKQSWTPMSPGDRKLDGLDGPRFHVHKRFLRVRIQERWYLMQVATSPEERTMEYVKAYIIDSKDVAAYAHRFNSQLFSMAGADESLDLTAPDEDPIPRVQVCAPIVCSVIETAIPQLVGGRRGEVVTLTPFPSLEVGKFVFDGAEEFLELPHAFFHYAAWLSGGTELLFDIQGAENEEGDVILIDPCVLRVEKPEVSHLFTLGNSAPHGQESLVEQFDLLHRRCGPLCKSFDPERKGPRARRMCGFEGSCGFGVH